MGDVLGASAGPGFESVVGGRGEVGLVRVDGVVERFAGGGGEVSDCCAEEYIVLTVIVNNIWFISQINISTTLKHEILVSRRICVKHFSLLVSAKVGSIKQVETLLIRTSTLVNERTT